MFENQTKHLKAEEKPLRLKQWDEMTDEDKLDRSIEQSMINKELQKRQDQEKLKVSRVHFLVQFRLSHVTYLYGPFRFWSSSKN